MRSRASKRDSNRRLSSLKGFVGGGDRGSSSVAGVTRWTKLAAIMEVALGGKINDGDDEDE